MGKFHFLLACALGATAVCNADVINVEEFGYAGPFAIKAPVMIDSVDVNSKAYNAEDILNTNLRMKPAADGELKAMAVLPKTDTDALHVLSFSLDNHQYAKAAISAEAGAKCQIFVDGIKTDGKELELLPATHQVFVKCLTKAGEGPDSIKVTVETETPAAFKTNVQGGRQYTLKDVMDGRRITGVSLSPSGKYMIVDYSYTEDGGETGHEVNIFETATGKKLQEYGNIDLKWMPSSDIPYYIGTRDGKNNLITLNPINGLETVLVEDVPSRRLIIAPTEDFAIYNKRVQGPKEQSEDVYEILNPEDRQPGWRYRMTPYKFDFKTGLSTPLTFGHTNVMIADISADGKKALVRNGGRLYGERPTSRSSLYLMDLESNGMTPLIEDEGFWASASFSPDASKVVLTASPEAFGGIGKNLPEGMTPSTYDYQLYIMDIATKDIKPYTRDFNPCVQSVVWSKADGNIYFTAQNRDLISLYRMNPTTGKIDDLGSKEECVTDFATAKNSPVIAYFGQGACNSDRLYTISGKKQEHKLIEDIDAQRMKGIKIGECHQWDYLNSRGDTICARYILPADFDPAKKYPMIVNYYGGCNPTSRTFEGRYPHHVYAANGYVVLVIVPSGATGFGQEYSARHVNTAGEGVAQDIIEGVKKFTAEHPWVNADKIGCIGASYGGFMTQYLQTQTDIFAAAISHAGISDHTSYWGNGYWGYSYSEVSMANSYPWSDQDLYVKQSPLYNADKIHAPLLFVHGDADTNVPFGESIQMFTALKLLGRPTALVAVKGANHHILEYEPRQRWQNTIFAWFAKYLQDDPSWWESMYPEKAL